MSGRRIAAVARRIVEQFRHDRRSLAFLVLVPILMLTLIGYLFQPASGGAREPVALVNQDQGVFGEALVRVLRQVRSLDARVLSAEEAATQLADGTVHAIVRFAPTFSADSQRAGRVALAIQIEGSDMSVNASVLTAFQRTRLEIPQALPAFGSAPSPGLELMTLDVSYLHGGADWSALDYLAPAFIPFLAFFFVFLLTNVSFLRERSSGTLERLLASPLRRSELVLGYLAGFAVFAILQSVVVVAYALAVLHLRTVGGAWLLLAINVLLALGTVNLGLFLSTFARNEFQAVQFIPVVVLPQALLSGLLIPVAGLPDVLRPLAWLMPLTYAIEASRAVMVKGAGVTDALVRRDLGALVLIAVILAAAATRTIRRET